MEKVVNGTNYSRWLTEWGRGKFGQMDPVGLETGNQRIMSPGCQILTRGFLLSPIPDKDLHSKDLQKHQKILSLAHNL